MLLCTTEESNAYWAAADHPSPHLPRASAAARAVPTRIDSQRLCGHGTIVGYNPSNTEILLIPVRCKSWDCPTCGPKKRALWIARLARGNPQREITLTTAYDRALAPREHARLLKQCLNRLLKALRKRDPGMEYALVWELTKKGTPHVHMLQRGTYIPAAWLSKQWDAAGGGKIVWIESVRGKSLHAAHCCKYLGKATGQTARELAPLRIIQVSRHYILPEPTPSPRPETADYSWTYSPLSVKTIHEKLEHTITPHETVIDDDGSVWISFQTNSPAFELVPHDRTWWYDVEPTNSTDTS